MPGRCVDYPKLLVSVLAFDMGANTWRLLMYVDLIVVYYTDRSTCLIRKANASTCLIRKVNARRYVDLIVVYHNPFEPNTARPLYHVLVVVAAGAWAVTISNSRLLCTSSETSSSLNVMTLTWGLVYAPFLLFLVVGGRRSPS